MASEIRATVFTVKEVLEHPNADKLEIVQPLGWQVICAKGLRKKGQKCVYIQPNSVIPDEWAEKWGIKQYLKGSNKNIVSQIKLRGEPSFGFIIEADNDLWEDGENVADFYGIKKYEPPIKVSDGDAETPNELFCKYTDIENLRNYPDVFEDGEEVIVTEKIHGSNCRVGVIDNKKMAGSMEINRKEPLTAEAKKTNRYWFPWTITSVNNLLIELSKKHKQVILFGEVYGTSIQKQYFYDTDASFIGFRAFDLLIDGKYMDYDIFIDICNKYLVPIVPVLYKGSFSLNKIKEISNGMTTLGNKNIREGVVLRPTKERRNAKVGRLVMKYVGDDYLLSKHDDSKDH